MKKAQLASLDVLAALFGFLLVMIFVISLWAFYLHKVNYSIETRGMQLNALQAVDTLVKSSGTPVNWERNPNASEAIGLSAPSGLIDPVKLAALLKLDYNSTATKLKIKSYNYNLSILHINGTVLNTTGIPINSTKQTISIDRLIMVENEIKKLSFTLWKK